MAVLSTDELFERIYMVRTSDPKHIFFVPAPDINEIKDETIDLVLGNHFIVTKMAKFSAIEALGAETLRDIASYQERVLIPFGKTLFIHPGSFILAVTWQYIGLPNDICAQVTARSTWGRAGLTVATATAVHSNFSGCLTLELVNNGNAPIALYPGSRIAQIIFMDTNPASTEPNPKSSKYFGMTEPGFTRLYDEKTELQKWGEVGSRASFQNNLKTS